MVDTITLKKPFDSHLHVRRGAMLRAVTPYSVERFWGALVMPNTEPPIDTVEAALEYKKEILAAVPPGKKFQPLMSFYLTKKLSPEEIEKGVEGGVAAVKYYPYGATTNSQWGYPSILAAKDVLKKMEAMGMPILLHGEVHINDDGEEVDPVKGEEVFITDVLPRLLEAYPKLKVSLEHLSTARAVEFMEENGKEGFLVATITPHHLMYDNTNSSPLLRCKPLLKSPADKERLRAFVSAGHAFISAGTDSAPHPESKKLTGTPAFGAFSAPAAVECYAEVFAELGALDKLENFLSINGPRFFGLEPSVETITLEKKDWQMTDPVVTEEGVKVFPICHIEHGLGNETIHWKVAP